ncbi:hypothetical protein [Deinococcus koreensis]|uniref:Uncharacterized protein n=1 Tax=Deinococcus koreensis TaxID=2054903 RepID=A0A2K3UTP5_9DEIO|nr:hypothetical protein [Deinococcus koreensis]PNY79912.1 hypothetical protein CVO96_18430 [Deinococcus koreensis]
MEEYSVPARPVTPEPRPQRLTRAQQRFLGVVGLGHRPDADAQPPERVRLSPGAAEILRGYYYAPGAYRSGPLFGTRHLGQVEVTHVARGGYPRLNSAIGEQPFALDPQYVLAWSDCASQYGTSEVEWVGQWLMQPDNRRGSAFEQDSWVRQAHRLALVDGEHFLLMIGEEAGTLHYHAALCGEGEAWPVAVDPLEG